MRYYITGDCHGDFKKIEWFCKYNETTKDDIMIVLGDFGVNYALDRLDIKRKVKLSKLPLSFLGIHGNHEARPYEIDTYRQMVWHGGVVYYEPEYPNILFAKDGEIYQLGDKKAIAIGGAYSVDKNYRLMVGLPWYEDEQPTAQIKEYVEEQLERCDWKVDYILSHTTAFVYEPTDLFLNFIDQSRVDKSTEMWLSEIERKTSYDKWYFGHFHENREYANAEMLFEGIKELGKDKFVQKVGRPQYIKKEIVMFYYINQGETIEEYGRIEKINDYGNKGQYHEVSYTIRRFDGTIFENIPESDVYGFSEKREDDDTD